MTRGGDDSSSDVDEVDVTDMEARVYMRLAFCRSLPKVRRHALSYTSSPAAYRSHCGLGW